LNVNREKLRTVAFEGIKKFLAKLHIYKSMGDFEAGKKMFDGYSVVDEEMTRVRDIVIANKIPRRINLQPNVLLDSNHQEPYYKGYDESFEGVVMSYTERFSDAFVSDVYKEWNRDAKIMRRID
jgi:dipeptidyl-peptidase III